MTQQDIVNRVNSYLINYRVNWYEIMYFADGAINKINDLLGACYPPMSEILGSGNASYTLKQDGKDIPIFPDKYISSVVVPFIITEVLAKDEEFTTIYNKFATDFDNNLYMMYQNEFNRVPLCFRQRSDVGVFIDTFDLPQCVERVDHIGLHKLPTFDMCEPEHNFTFKVSYSYGNADVVVSNSNALPTVTKTFNYGDTYTISTANVDSLVSVNGDVGYHFVGWTTEKNGTTSMTGDITIKGDTTLYAIWAEEDTLEVYDTDYVRVKSDYLKKITNLIVPAYLKCSGKRVTSLKSGFIGTPNTIETVTLPTTLSSIEADAFKYFIGTTINFPKYNEIYDAPNIQLGSNALRISNANISKIYIPKSVRNIDTTTFNVQRSSDPKYIDIYFEYLQNNIPSTYTLPTSSYITYHYGCTDISGGVY